MAIKRTPLEQFRTDNGLLKKDLAAYLGVSPAFVGRVCSGDYNLPSAQYERLLHNDKDWDTSALINFPDKNEPELLANSAGVELFNRLMETLTDLGETQSEYINLISSKDAQIAKLTNIIENLTQALSLRLPPDK